MAMLNTTESTKTRDFDDLKYPRRRPWLLVLVVLVVALIIVQRQRIKNRPPVEAPPPPPVEEVVPAPVKPVVTRIAKPVAPSPVKAPVPAAPVVESVRKPQPETKLEAARRQYLAALQGPLDAQARKTVEESLGALHVQMVTTDAPMAEKVKVVVARGDSVDRMARRLNTTVDLITTANRIQDPNRIRIGDSLMVLKGTFRLVVSKKNRDMVLYLNDAFFKRYPVGIGKNDKTPVGTFRITDKIKNPTWWRPDGREVPFGNPENILGTRWMAIQATGDTPAVRGYGIHGTWDDASIGKAESAGCIRMRNKDVEELFLFLPIGVDVRIDS